MLLCLWLAPLPDFPYLRKNIENMNSFILRPWQESDVPALAKYLNNKKIWDNCRDRLPYPYTSEDAASFIQYAKSQDVQNNYCIEVNAEAVGNISFDRGTDVERFNAEIGYWIAEPHWNKGIMTQALCQAVSDYFSKTDIMRIFANVYAYNFASMRVLEKAGFQKTGIQHSACFKNGQFLDCHCFELLKEDTL